MRWCVQTQHLNTLLCFLHLFFICAFNSVTVQKHDLFIQTHGITKKWWNLQTSFPLTLRASWQKQEILLTDQHVQCTTEGTNSWNKPSSNVNDSYKPSLLQLVQLWPSSIVSDGRTQSCAETTTPGLFWTNTMGTVCSASCTEHTGIYIHCSSYRCYYLNNHGQKDKIHPKYRNMDEERGQIPSQSITLRSPQPAVLPGQVKKKKSLYRKCVEDHYNSNDTRGMWKSITAINWPQRHNTLAKKVSTFVAHFYSSNHTPLTKITTTEHAESPTLNSARPGHGKLLDQMEIQD